MSAQAMPAHGRESSVAQLEVDGNTQLAQSPAQVRRQREAAHLARRDGDDHPNLAAFRLDAPKEFRMPAQDARGEYRQRRLERGDGNGLSVPRDLVHECGLE